MKQARNQKSSPLSDPLLEPVQAIERTVLDEASFRQTIAVERKRTERSKAPFLLMLVEAGCEPSSPRISKALGAILAALQSCTRDTDVVGWYKERATAGAIFTGLEVNSRNTVLNTILGRVSAMLKDELTYEEFSQVNISFHFFPDDWDHDNPDRPSNPKLYPDIEHKEKDKRLLLVLKRSVDLLAGSVITLLCAPLFLIIALAVKLTSKGPVFFQQKRVGQHGKCFTFLKFRSMYVNNDEAVHKEYVVKLIANQAELMPAEKAEAGVYKLTKDRRITRIGRLLRRTSLDELPQLFNVLKGDMSLVGPRPPIPYELAAYQTWHRRRLLEVKPGITGLWQVTGRSQVSFDEMVRLDLRYAMTWTPWLDFKILLRTPRAVIKGSGAY